MTDNDVTWLTLVRPLVESSSSPPQSQRTQLKIVPRMRPVLGGSVLFTNIQNIQIILQTVSKPTSSWAGNTGDCWETLFGGVVGNMCGYMTTEKTHNATRCNSVLQRVFSATHCKQWRMYRQHLWILKQRRHSKHREHTPNTENTLCVVLCFCGCYYVDTTENSVDGYYSLWILLVVSIVVSTENTQMCSVLVSTHNTLVWVHAQCREKTHMKVHTVERTFIWVHTVCALVCVHVVCSLMCACTLMSVCAMSVYTHKLCLHSLCVFMCLRHTHGTHTLECTFMCVHHKGPDACGKNWAGSSKVLSGGSYPIYR